MQNDRRRLRAPQWPGTIPLPWLAVMALLLVPALALAQSQVRLPRIVLDAPDGTRGVPDLASLPAAWRVTLDVSAASSTDEVVRRLDARAPAGRVWLRVEPGALGQGDVPALVKLLRDLVSRRPTVQVVEPLLAGLDQRLATFFTRQLAVELKSVRKDVAIAVHTPAATLNAWVDAGLAPLLDVLVLDGPDDAALARTTLSEGGLTLRTAVLGQPLSGEQTSAALARAEIGRIAGAVDVAGYRVVDPSLRAVAQAIRALDPVLSQDVNEIEADLRLALGETEVTTVWPWRVLFGVESLGTFVAVDVPATGSRVVEMRLVVPVAGDVALIDPERGIAVPVASQRDDTTQTTTATVTFPSAGRWLVDFNRGADGSFVQREDVTASRTLTLDEILARHQLRQAAERRAAPRYISDGTMQQYFRPTVTDPGFDVFTENRYYVDQGDIEWEEFSFAVNGARWDTNRPAFPLLQPEKVLSPPLVIELDARYRYRLAGIERVDGLACYVVRFDPIDAARSLYRGTVWIATDSFARVKQQVVQTNLTAPVVSNDETQQFAPVRLPDGREVYLPSRTYNQQLVLIAGRNLLVERRMTFSNYVVDPPDFEARRLEARRSDRIMYRDTDTGARDYVKQGDVRVVSDRSTTTAKAQAIGVTIDPSYAYPLPMFGINYLNFEFMGRKDTQLAVLFAGVLAAGNLQRPQIAGRKVDLNVDFFGIAVPGSDRLYAVEGEREGERLLTWPLSTGLNLGFQGTSYQKLTAQYQFRFDGYVRDRTTAEDYTTPSSTVTNGLGVLYEYRRAGYAVTASGVLARRASWREWGPSTALQASSPDYEKYAMNATKTIYLGPFSKLVVNGAWFTGRRLDRFSQYQFGLFDDTRIRGVPSSGVRYGELAMARGQYSFNLFEQYRLDVFLDRGWGRTRDVGVPWEGITGIGAAVNVRIPNTNLILRADVGKSFLPDRYRRLGSTVVQILFLRPLK